jgi:phosphoribosylaminoimidazolecarboxamide formyltransferase/IMP cyclohydrolase
MSDALPIRTALLSVSDKTDLIPFARRLHQHGARLVSTGGTARKLTEAGFEVTPVEQLTGFPEMMDGRVKTLHPNVHGGLLALRDNPEHAQALERHHITAIDLVCVNLYPFEQTVANPQVSEQEAIENIDIGGPSMIRSAAKNHRYVTCVTSTKQYDAVCTDMDANEGCITLRVRRTLAAAAFARTAEYDQAIAAWMANRWDTAPPESGGQEQPRT